MVSTDSKFLWVRQTTIWLYLQNRDAILLQIPRSLVLGTESRHLYDGLRFGAGQDGWRGMSF